MRVYISGSITDGGTITNPVEIKRREALFHDAARLLAPQHQPLNPAREEGRENCVTWLDYMRASLMDLAQADGIALLPGWQKSSGAKVERDLGVALGLIVAPLQAWLEGEA